MSKIDVQNTKKIIQKKDIFFILKNSLATKTLRH